MSIILAQFIGKYHSHENMASRSFANANNYFLKNYGSNEVELKYPILCYGGEIGKLHCFFNYEYIGASYGYEKTSTPIGGYIYMDGHISSNVNYLGSIYY